MKRFSILMILVAILMVPAFAFAADKFVPAKAQAGTGGEVIIPLEITNQDGLMAIDIPLTFSEGVTLKEVTFEGTRTEYFDLKIANINNEDNIVIIGLVTQITSTAKPMLSAGSGAVANLVFEVDDPSVSEITLEATTMDSPHHRLMYVYNQRAEGELAHQKVEPDFEAVTVALSGVGLGLPTSYSLEQNYPNPFNPSTIIAYSLPQAGAVSLEVFNVLGQRVVTLVDEHQAAGYYEQTWDGRNAGGQSVSSGVYFYRVTSENFVDTKKMMLLK
ncbi:MAG: T9SS type A sorting domain-containing protein [candidate division Zixibacteria bacterium]|nr:T9SS type A sorting domain-containing protein [candidate division Zixibacteria bacterium]